MFNPIGFWTYMVIPVITFPGGIILRLGRIAGGPGWFGNSKLTVDINKGRVNFLSFQINSYTIRGDGNGLANGGDLPVFYRKHSLFYNSVWIYMNAGIFKDRVIGVFCLHTIILWEIIL